MNIPKAIEILTDVLNSSYYSVGGDYKDAIKLGRDALKRVQSVRTSGFRRPKTPLPGEEPE